jgi:RNA polymerase sigma-70 factor, ECF subfamily
LTSRQQEEIEALFLKYGRGIGSYVLARVGNAELAEEITSKIFLRVVRFYGQQRESAAGWLWSIVRSEVARNFRDRRAVVSIDDSNMATSETMPAQQLIDRETNVQLHRALSQLSEDDQQIVYMKFFQDMSHQEIAEAAGITPNNVGVIVFRTLKTLRELMQPRAARASTLLSVEIKECRL